RLCHHLLAVLLDRLLVFGDLAAPDAGRGVAEDDRDGLAVELARHAQGRVERRVAARRAVVSDHDPAHHSATPVGPGAAASPSRKPAGTTSGLRLKKAGILFHCTHISTTPRIRKKTAITSGGPRPSHELPDSELAGSASSIPFLTSR